MSDLPFHPLADLFPLLEGMDFTALVEDVRANGLLEPIVVHDGYILDGRNRYRACHAAQVPARYEPYSGADPVAYVISINLRRRHMSESQRAMVAAKLANLAAHRPRSDKSANLPGLGSSTVELSQSKAADLLNVSERSIRTARTVQADAPEISRAVEAGSVSLHLASQVVDLPDDEKGAVVEAIAASPNEAKEIAREAVRAHVANNSGNNEWYTPAPLIKAAIAVMGRIDVDPASSEIANRTVGAAKFYDAEADGLKQSWAGKVWMNPPYAQPLIEHFTLSLLRKFQTREVTEACVLVNNATETGWFQGLLGLCSAACFIRSRVKFLDPDGKPGAPLQGQAVIYFGDSPESFSMVFVEFGKVMFA